MRTRILRTLTGALVAGGLAVSLAACSSDDDAPSSSTNADSSPNSSTDAFPTTVATKFGDIEIDEKPEKVVAVGWGDAETAMALGVQPIGVPDEEDDSYLTGPDEQVSMIAQALGETGKGDEILQARADRAEQIKADHPEWEGKTLSAVGASTTWGVFLPGSVRVDPLMQLGFTLNEKIANTSAGDNVFSVSLTDETLGDADADVVLAYPISKTEDEIADNDAWKRLPAVKNGHGTILPKEVAQAFSMGTPQAYDFGMDKMLPILEEYVAA